ncbi:patatin-like phospholipase family protein [Sinorhizobium sp. BG8]|uniref:patatin-like phospholipase family protein n=1 Tax=Sinorhizobium sp. BG8 TaxID=2613773 RepID=UPI00193E9356|nr:patatin-like phospholipase family protein [Sinorhizobium sp. BG8]QRM53839.1 hypothetical protein F3Y30_04160 [Sinorhizobium sp. BG8]
MTDTNAALPYANPTKNCDLIMKGGITSGVVFPHAICELAKTYRFHSIGGTSAGAIGAVMAAAAEYRRSTSTDPVERNAGFERVNAMPDVLAARLPTFFQPSQETKPLFSIGMAAIRAKGSKVWAVLLQTLRSFAKEVIIGAIPGLLIALLSRSIEGALLGLVLLLIGVLGMLVYALYRAVTTVLPSNDFGLCSGLTQPGETEPGFTDWIAAEIEAVAGRSGGDPLTIGDLTKAEIRVASVTTDLSSRRPYELPFATRVHCFRKSEFELLFPPSIMNYLLRVSSKREATGKGIPSDFYDLPPSEELPVAVIARMSLSFPGLIRAVPLYRRDLSLVPTDDSKEPVPVRCLFSDGGITSNFPIHLFDSLLPSRPTFGISLASYDPRRHSRRVFMPNTFQEGEEEDDITPVLPVSGLSGFVASILSTARNWQDTLQSQLHGYSERIVEIRLDDSKEGGLNLDMEKKTVSYLSELGKEAGTTVISNFSFNEHRWRRAITALPTLAQSLKRMQERFDAEGGPVGTAGSLEPGAFAYETILSSYTPTGFVDLSGERREALRTFAEKAAAAGHSAGAPATDPVTRQKANLRIAASMETSARAPSAPPPPPAPNG